MVDAFRKWARQQLTRIPGKGELAKAFRHGLSRWSWSSLPLFLEDGRVAIDNSAPGKGRLQRMTLSFSFSFRRSSCGRCRLRRRLIKPKNPMMVSVSKMK